MALEHLVTTYGYLALLLGTFFEGETILILGGFLAHRGYLHLPLVILAAFFGGFLADELSFFAGRWKGEALLAKHPRWQSRTRRVNDLLDRYHTPLILGFRFLYGLRIATPFVLGMSSVKTVRFVMLNAAGAVVWAVLIGGGGYLFGTALEALLRDVRKYEFEAAAGILIAGMAFWLVHSWRRRRRFPS
jgi:membrane protein DedA with SNARE-associated domain